ncbi:MAG: peptidylprolyl isomerase [Symploca sp. SIO1A3]|nr:peptidylprolyl isomerase [Symploca sp. SIO1A3]
MESIPFLTIDQESISLSQALKYLRAAGSLQRTLGDILRQYVLEKQLEVTENIEIDSLKLDQVIMDFRLENQLTEPQQFQTWLKSNGMTYDDFQRKVAFSFKVENLKTEITESKLEDYFNQRKPFLDGVVLSRIILKDQELAANLQQQILADQSKFEALAREHSLSNDRMMNGMMGVVSRGKLPEILKTALDSASPGELIGPLEINGGYALFRVEQFLPATLEGKLKQDLQNQLFEQWLEEKLQGMNIKLEKF